MKYLKKLNRLGFSHIETMMVVLFLVVLIGIGLYVKSRAITVGPGGGAVAAPNAVQLIKASNNSVYISWPTSVTPGVNDYEIIRNGSIVGNTSSTSYLDASSIQPQTSYKYQIVAVTGYNTSFQRKSSFSGTLNVNTISNTPPPLPNITPASSQIAHLQAANNIDSNVSTTNTKSLETSSNWAGYLVYSNNFGLNYVQSSIQIPQISCDSQLVLASKSQMSDVSFWVGLDGAGDQTVEQDGISEDCTVNSNNKVVPSYYAWIEMYPGNVVPLNFIILPGDNINMSTDFSTSSGKFNFTVTDSTISQTVKKSYACTANGNTPCYRNSAEVVIERDDLCYCSNCNSTAAGCNLLNLLTAYNPTNMVNNYIGTTSSAHFPLGQETNYPMFMTSSTSTALLAKVSRPLPTNGTTFSTNFIATH